jgi:hypothetical protein
LANNIGDFDTAAVVYGKFTSVRVDTGAPATLAGTPALSVYKDNSTTQSTTGVTLTADFDAVTGFNHFAIDTSTDGTFYSAGSFFDVVITTGTVNSVSAVGYCVGQFTLRKVSALKPTVAGRALDVSTTGEAGVDWANVGSPTTTVGLTGTTIATSQVVASVTGTVGSVTGSVGSVTGNVGGNVVGSVGSVTAAVALTSAERNSVADALLDRNMATGTDSGSPSVRTVRQALRFLRNKWTIAAGTLTVTKEDDTTSSWTAAITTTAGNPVSGSDPA